MYDLLSGQALRVLRDGIGLTRTKFFACMQPYLEFKRARGELQLYAWERGRQLPGQDFADAAFQVLKEHGVDDDVISELTQTLQQDRLRQREQRLSHGSGVSILDSGHVSHIIANEYETFLDPQLSFSSQLRTAENLLIWLRCCPELIPIEWQEKIITRFLALRVGAVYDISREILSGQGLSDNQLSLYYDPPLTPQISLLAPFKHLDAGHVDFHTLPEITKTIGYRTLLQGLRDSDWTHKTEYAFLLRHFDQFVPEEQRHQIAELFIDLIDADEAQDNPWLAWPCLKGAMKYTEPNTPKYDGLIHRAKRHPSELIRLGINLLVPGPNLTNVLQEVTDLILQSPNQLTCNEHVFVYYLYELCVLLPQIAQQIQRPLPRRLLSSISEGIASRRDWNVASRVEDTLLTIVSPYLEKPH